jgi:[NiFe] hydrogenase assembly HybE family chaperone
MSDRADIGQLTEACFEEIRTTRMTGIPILNEALSVEVVGAREWNGDWLAVLVTPWFMNLMLVRADEETETLAQGAKRHFAFPAGQFEFIHGREDAIGSYWMCSLFSPVFEFSDQESAEAAAAAALDALFEDGGETDMSEGAMAQMWRGETPERTEPEVVAPEEEKADIPDARPARPEVSRRAFLTGGRREERP